MIVMVHSVIISNQPKTNARRSGIVNINSVLHEPFNVEFRHVRKSEYAFVEPKGQKLFAELSENRNSNAERKSFSAQQKSVPQMKNLWTDNHGVSKSGRIRTGAA